LKIEDLWYRFRLRLRLRPDRSLSLFYLNRSVDSVVDPVVDPEALEGRLSTGRIACKRSRVQRFRGSRLHSHPGTAFGMRIYDKSVRFVRLNQYLEPNWQLIEEMSIFSKDFGSLMPSLFLTPWPRPDFTMLNYLDSYLGA
jgi:hypothetical protein